MPGHPVHGLWDEVQNQVEVHFILLEGGVRRQGDELQTHHRLKPKHPISNILTEVI